MLKLPFEKQRNVNKTSFVFNAKCEIMLSYRGKKKAPTNNSVITAD